MRITFIVFAFVFSNAVRAQPIPPSFIREECKIQIFNLHKGERKTRFTRNKNHVVVSFNEGFSDSLLCYVNGVVYMNEFVKSDSLGRGYSCASFKIDFGRFKSSSTPVDITIVLPKMKLYTSFAIDKKYALIKIHHLQSTWPIVKTNYVPEYQ